MRSKKYALFDLDGTLINIDSCQHLIGEWDQFHVTTLKCPPNQRMVEFARLMQGCAEIMVVTGKPIALREPVRQYLSVQGIQPEAMLMRPDLNMESDAELKVKLVSQFFGRNWQERILFAVEDRDKMVEAWRAQGITCLQCGPSLY